MARSTDSGRTWSAPKAPHGDVTPTEHGFVSWLQLGDTASIVSLDGRQNAAKGKAKQATQLASASITAEGDSNSESMIEPMICDSDHTALLRVRSVNRDGTRSLATEVANFGEGKRAGGAPKLVQQGNHVLLTWTDMPNGSVKTATVKTS